VIICGCPEHLTSHIGDPDVIWTQQTSLEAHVRSTMRGCLFVTDRYSKRQFWIKMGPDLRVYPHGLVPRCRERMNCDLCAANGTIIHTYRWLPLSLNFGLRRDFTWRFVVADITRQISDTFLDRTSPTPSLALSLSLRPHHTTHWPHRRTAMTSSEHSWGQPPPYGWRNYQSPAPRSPSTATPLPGDLDCTFQLPYSSKCSSPSMICRTRPPKQWQSWSHSTSYGQACRIAAPGHVLVSPDSTPKSPVTR
jgi:hypothetical protein